MNGKLKRQLIKFYNGVIELRDNNEDFRNFTFILRMRKCIQG